MGKFPREELGRKSISRKSLEKLRAWQSRGKVGDLFCPSRGRPGGLEDPVGKFVGLTTVHEWIGQAQDEEWRRQLALAFAKAVEKEVGEARPMPIEAPQVVYMPIFFCVEATRV